MVMVVNDSVQSNENVIRDILASHAPNLDEDINDYLIGYLVDDIGSLDLDTLESTVTQFLGDQDDISENVLSKLVESLKKFVIDAKEKENAKDTSIHPLMTPDNDNPSSNQIPAKMLSTDLAVDSNETSDNAKAYSDTNKDKDNDNAKKKRADRKAARRNKRQEKKKEQQQATTQPEATPPPITSDNIDDHESAWQDCLKEGKKWGGRGHGGRGVQGSDNIKNIYLSSVSLNLAGNELLQESEMHIDKGHRYGLLGRNGVGKSTLLSKLAQHAIPGIPHAMRILLVQQQIEGRDDKTAIEVLVESDLDRLSLLQEQEQVESNIEQGIDLEQNAERLNGIIGELDAISADSAEDRAIEILKGLQFTNAMINGPTSSLSGGWRMRLALAKALFVPSSDIILLDECTNHLDLYGVNWLVNYLQNSDHTLIVVSHDRAFLDAICTDIVVMEHLKLTYHVGNYSEYQLQMSEKATRQAQILDAAARQRAKAEAFVQKQQANANKKSADPNKQRQAKMIKDKKLDRIGNYREDGKRYKTHSLKQMDMASARLAQKVEILADAPVIKMKFPNPVWPPGISEGAPIVQFDNVSFAYDGQNNYLLRNVTLSIHRGSKIAVVGKNGAGKTTLLRLITGENGNDGTITGDLWKHPNIRIGHVTQYSVEELESYKELTVVEYAEQQLVSGRAASQVIASQSGNVRQYLGAFGLGGQHAHRPIGKLSGGERMRLCFATVLADEPHMLMLDESTNHVDLETLDSMSSALNLYEGSVVMVSHNQGFLSGFCRQLWVVENGHVSVSHDDADTFDEVFSGYRNSVMSSDASTTRSNQRKQKAGLAKKASNQRAGTSQNTSLFG